MTDIADPSPVVERLRPQDAYGTPDDNGWRHLDWARYERDEIVLGRRLHFVDIGDGPATILLVHGMASSWQWWLESIPALAEYARVIAVDLPGFGQSEMPRRLSMDSTVTSLRTLVQGLGPVSVLGHSMGTLVACELAAKAPEQVDRLVLAGGPILSVARLFHNPIGTLLAQPRVASFLIEAATAGLPLPERVQELIVANRILRRLAFGTYVPHPHKIPRDLLARLLRGVGAAGALPTLASGFGYSHAPALQAVRRPTLLVGGTRDNIAPVPDLMEFARMAPVEKVVVLEDTGHWPMIERPSAFNDVVREFLRGTSAKSALA